MTFRARIAPAMAVALIFTLMNSCAKPPSILQRIKARGVIRVVTLNGATTYYLGSNGPAGLDYDLAKRFAQRLGVRLRVIVANRLTQVTAMLNAGEADIAAAGISATAQRRRALWFAPTLRSITSQLVYKRGGKAPHSLKALHGVVGVVAGSAQAEHVAHFAQGKPELHWKRVTNMNNEELLYRVAKGKLAYTIAPSDQVAINRRYYPDLQVAFDLGKSQPVAWALPQSHDDSLYNQTIAFFVHIRRDGELKRLMDRYFGFVDRLNYVGRKRFERDARHRLPRYRATFKKAAEKYHLNWQLLAALAYQESHWKPRARSPTGVRGMMMLTRDTADFIGIDNRLDPRQSIMGGARYLRNLLDRLPRAIHPPDRLWMALAAYNIGLGHITDARQLTLELGGNPDSWVDVRTNLPLLTQKKWYSRLHSGYARGHETVTYVGNIRNYDDILAFTTATHARPEAAKVIASDDSTTATKTTQSASGAKKVASKPHESTPGDISIKTE